MKKRIVLVSTMLALGAMADEWYDETTGFTWRYTISGNEARLDGVSPTEGELPPLPSELGGKPVTSIGNCAFECCSGLTGSLVVPDSMTSIGNRAFYGCGGFNGSLSLGNSVSIIDYCAFYGCSGFTGSLVIPDSVTSIGNSAFSDCSGFTGSLVIPDSVTSIGNSAFSGCSGFNGSLTLGNSVSIIGNGAFSDCSGFIGSLVIPDCVTSIGSCAFENCRGFTGSLTIGANVENLGGNAFSGCSGFTGSLTIGSSVKTIDSGAFQNCSGFSGSLNISKGVISIGSYAFSGCGRLTGLLVIPESVTSIGSNAFSGCHGLTGLLVIPESVTSIGSYAFSGCHGLTGQSCMFLGLPPKGVEVSKLFFYMDGVVFPEQYGAEWQKYLPVFKWRERLRSNLPEVTVVSAQMREGDQTVMDVVYKVTSTNPTVKVRALAFQDGERSFAKIVRPETFVDGTGANLGDGITANEEHTLSWKVSADWQTTLAKVKFEVLAVEDDILPLELVTLPADGTHPAMRVSWNYVAPDRLFDALLWLYADHDLGLTVVSGVLKNGDVRLASGASVSGADTMYEATRYVYGKMGYELLQGETLEYVKERTRLDLPGISERQYAVKVLGE